MLSALAKTLSMANAIPGVLVAAGDAKLGRATQAEAKKNNKENMRKIEKLETLPRGCKEMLNRHRP